jgi:hypothetical protein
MVAANSFARGVSERQARRVLLERKIAAFDLIAERETRQAARDARAHAAEALEQLVAWHRQDLDERLTVDAAADASIEGYRFALDGRPVAELFFTAEGSAEDTGWFRCAIDDRAPASPIASENAQDDLGGFRIHHQPHVAVGRLVRPVPGHPDLAVLEVVPCCSEGAGEGVPAFLEVQGRGDRLARDPLPRLLRQVLRDPTHRGRARRKVAFHEGRITKPLVGRTRRRFVVGQRMDRR